MNLSTSDLVPKVAAAEEEEVRAAVWAVETLPRAGAESGIGGEGVEGDAGVGGR